jgi:uncharacterized coiled-coil protein SlyX
MEIIKTTLNHRLEELKVSLQQKEAILEKMGLSVKEHQNEAEKLKRDLVELETYIRINFGE